MGRKEMTVRGIGPLKSVKKKPKPFPGKKDLIGVVDVIQCHHHVDIPVEDEDRGVCDEFYVDMVHQEVRLGKDP